MTNFKITISSALWPPGIASPIVSIVVFKEAENSFAAYQYAKAVAMDYFGEEMSIARYSIEEIPA
jgi:hypothetical protein